MKIPFTAIVFEGHSCSEVGAKLEAMGFEVELMESLGAVSGKGSPEQIETAFGTRIEFPDGVLTLSTNPVTPLDLVKSVEAICIERPLMRSTKDFSELD